MERILSTRMRSAHYEIHRIVTSLIYTLGETAVRYCDSEVCDRLQRWCLLNGSL